MAKVTLKDIAEAVGVSRMTVSNAFSRPDKLSAALRTRILETAEDMGYAGPDPSARALARGRSGTVGMLITESLGEAFRDPVSTELLVAVADALSEHELALTLITAGRGGASVPARDLSMDGALVYVCEQDSVDAGWLRKRGLPMVAIDQVAASGTPAVNVDDRAGARAAGQHLVELGHRRVGLLNLSAGGAENPPSVERDLGWREALEPAGVEVLEARARFRPPEAAFEAALTLLDRPDRPTAVLCFSDVYAAQVLLAAEKLGLQVPGDLSVVGYDDSSLATTVRPSLTTVHQPVSRKGRAAVEALVALMGAGQPAEEHLVLPTELVVRDSTGPAPRS